MRYRRAVVVTALVAIALVASLFVAPSAGAASRPISSFEARVQRGTDMAMANGDGSVSRAVTETRVRKALAYSDAQRGASPLGLWGDNVYSPGSAWNWAGDTYVVDYDYVIETFPQGCRPGVFFTDTKNGVGTGNIAHEWETPKLELAGGHTTLKRWLFDYARTGGGYLAPSTSDGLYAPGVSKNLFGSAHSDPGAVSNIKSSVFGTADLPHYHNGNSHSATLICG